VHDTHVPALEVDHDPGGDVRQGTETDGGNDTTDETETEEDGGEREDTESDVLLSQPYSGSGSKKSSKEN